MGYGCSFSIFVSTLPTPSLLGNPSPGCCSQLQNCLVVPRPHDFNNNLYKNQKNRDNNFICEGCSKLRLMIGPQGRKEMSLDLFNQIAIINQSILFGLTDQAGEKVVVGGNSIGWSGCILGGGVARSFWR